MANILGADSFSDTPDVNGSLVLTAATGVTGVTGVANQTAVTGAVPSFAVGLATDPVIPGLQKIRIPSGATADRPASPAAADLRYNTTLNFPEVYNGTTWLPATGKVVQMVTGTIAATSGTTQTVLDNTAPTSSEGFQIWTQAFTPVYSTSRIVITFSVTLSHATVGRTFITSVFAGTTNIGSIVSSIGATTALGTAMAGTSTTLQVVYSPGATTAITFSARTGTNGTGTAYVNQTSGATLGGASVTEYTIMEIL